VAKSSGPLGFLDSPTGWILAGGTVYIAYLIWKAIETAGKKLEPVADEAVRTGTAALSVVGNVLSGQVSMVKPIEGPATESATAVLTASVVDPPPKGSAKRGLFAWSIRCLVAINNPGEKRPVELRVVASWAGFLWNDATQTVAVILAPPGRTLYEVTIPMTMINATGATKFLEVYLDGKNTGGAVEFSVS